MKMIGRMLFGLMAPAALADVLDDLGVTGRQLARSIGFPLGHHLNPPQQLLQGWPLSEARVAALAAERATGQAVTMLHESRGDFAKALESESLAPLDRVRLLLRAGRQEEARQVLEAEEIGSRLLHEYPVPLLQQACRPLEDEQAWDGLGGFLRLLAERLTTPHWRAAIWAEELDVAWHLDRLQPLLDGAAGDPLRLAFFHDRLGQRDERDRLAAGLLENAAPARIADLLWLLPDCPVTRTAAFEEWKRGDLALEDRRALLPPLLSLPRGEDFERILSDWLMKGGDALPLADLLWSRWASYGSDALSRAAVHEALLRRHPAEPRFRLPVARQVMKADPARAAGLFESVAVLPLSAAAEKEPSKWQRDDLRSVTKEVAADLPHFALGGLGLLNRQDRVRAVLDGQAGWVTLPLTDQVRYLAAGRMDVEGMKHLLAADFSKPENDVLGRWLASVLNGRLQERLLPPSVAAEIAAAFDRVVAGSPEKSINYIVSDAADLLRLLGPVEFEPAVMKASMDRLKAELEGRGVDWSKSVVGRLLGTAEPFPRLAGLFPAREKRRSEGDTSDFAKGMDARNWLVLFAPPEIRRIPTAARSDFTHGSFYGHRPGIPPVDRLHRWAVNFEGAMFFRQKKEGPRILPLLMRAFAPGDPRRLAAEILVARGVLDAGDEALKAESKSAMTALLAGEGEARGSELFRFATLAADGADEKELRKVLETVQGQPPVFRESFLGTLGQAQIQNRRALELAREVLGTVRRAAPPADTIAGDLEKLAGLFREEAPGPEWVAMAKRVLDTVASRESGPSPLNEVQPAVALLEKAGELEPWLKQARENLRQAGVPDVEALRRLQRIDGRHSPTGESRWTEYAREILSLDPSDATAARELVPVAASAGDRALLLVCLRCLGAEALSGSARQVLAIFTTGDAEEILSLVLPAEPDGRIPGPGAVEALHRYLLAADPRLAETFRDRMGSRGGMPAGSRREVAGQLLDAGFKDEAANVMARAFAVAPDYPGFPHAFPPKTGAAERTHEPRWRVTNFKEDLAFLAERKLLEGMLARMKEFGGIDKIAHATFLLAASPEKVTFDQQVLPLIADIGGTERMVLVQEWAELFEDRPNTAELVLRLLDERSRSDEGAEPHQLAHLIERAANQPGSARLIAETWARLLASEQNDPAKKEAVTSTVRTLLRPMLVSADDETWRSYWRVREADAAPLKLLQASPYTHAPTGFVDPVRMRQVLPRTLDEFQGKIPVVQAAGWVLAAVATGDEALVKRVRALLPAAPAEAMELSDLALGGTAGVDPMLGAATEENGETIVWWNFVTLPPVNREKGERDIPRPPFPMLDGKFELRVTAGSRTDRQVIVHKLDAAPAAGHVRLKLAPDQHHVALLAIEPATGVVRWTPPIDLRGEVGGALPDADLSARGFERLEWDGPGGLPAWKVRLSGAGRIDLLEREWDGSSPLAVDAWVSGDGKLVLHCLDAEGRELGALEMIAWEASQPVWQFRSIPAPEKNPLPAGTVRLVLSASAHGNSDGPRDFAVSNIRVSAGAASPLPEGFERVVRVPGEATALALSPDGKRLAIGQKPAQVMIVDLASRQVTGLAFPVSSFSQEETRVSRLVWGGSGLHVLGTNGDLLRFDEGGGKLEPVFSLRRGARQAYFSNVDVSPDGKWLAWREQDNRLMLASSDGKVRRDIPDVIALRFLPDGVGLRLFGGNGRSRLLKAGDFEAGEPVEEVQQPQEENLPPVWKDRLGFGGQRAERKAGRITLPGTRETSAITADGTLFYVDGAGNVIRVTP